MNSSALQDRRVWLGGGFLVALVLIAASWFMLVSPELSSASDVRTQAAGINAQNDVAVGKNAKLAQQDRGFNILQRKLRAALNSLPPDSGLPAFTDEVTGLARATGVSLSGVNVGTISAVAAAAPAAPAGSSPSSSSSTATPTTPTATTAGTTGGGQFSIPVTLNTAGSYRHQTAFLTALQNGPRRALVISSQLTVGASHAATYSATTMVTQVTLFSASMSKGQIAQLKTILAAKH